MKVKEGDIIYLTKRKWNKWHFWDYRGFLSYTIAKVTDSDKVHTAIVYKDEGWRVSEMESVGNINYTLKEYIDKYKDRIIYTQNPFYFNKLFKSRFNSHIINTKIKYDYSNLLLFQVFKAVFNRGIGRSTLNKNICSEYVAREYNVLNPGFFVGAEHLTPADIWNRTKWKTLKVRYDNK